MIETTPLIYWIRRDMRLSDHPGLSAAARSGRCVIPVFILDSETEAIGAAAKWRMELGLKAFRERLRAIGSDLILRRGDAREALTALAGETGAKAVQWTRLYDPQSIERDTQVKSALRAAGIGAESHPGHVIFEPWTVRTRADGGHYKVYSPYWRAVSASDIPPCLDPVTSLRPPDGWPRSENLEDWRMGAAMRRGAAILHPHACIGEVAAHDRLDRFLDAPVAAYANDRDRLDLDGTSGLSENLTYGEISPREAWQAAGRAIAAGCAGAQTFRKELAWREFAWHLIYHTPHIAERPWREDWAEFPWRPDNEDAESWRRGRTGVPVVDAAMREMFVTGRMHNRARMIVASYLTKHLMTDWRVGMRWFAECLTDWDPASNAMGWQWTAGCGPDAAPFFRVFNPETQAGKFDPDGRYRKRYLYGFEGSKHPDAASYFDAIPLSWRMSPGDPAPEPAIGLKAGRLRALDAYRAFREGAGLA